MRPLRATRAPARAAAVLSACAAVGLAACGEKEEPDLSTVPEQTETLTQPTTGTTTAPATPTTPTTPTTPQGQQP